MTTPTYLLSVVDRGICLEEELICAVFSGTAESKHKARQIAKSYQNCPYVYLMTTRGEQLFATFFLPKKQKWWIDYVEKKPKETFGLEKAAVTFADALYWPTKPSMRLPKRLRKLSPCGGNCLSCPAYTRCLHCPATVHYQKPGDR
jgi:hypothetical protein